MNKYKTQDLLLRAQRSMITSELIGDTIIIYVYTNSIDNAEDWQLFDSFDISRMQFNMFSNRISFLLANYIRKLCSMEVINGRIHEEN